MPEPDHHILLELLAEQRHSQSQLNQLRQEVTQHLSRHEAQDDARFLSIENKLDALVKKVYWLLGGLALLELIINGKEIIR